MWLVIYLDNFSIKYTSADYKLILVSRSVQYNLKLSSRETLQIPSKFLLNQQLYPGLGTPFQTWLDLDSSTDVEGSPGTGMTTLQSLEAGWQMLMYQHLYNLSTRPNAWESVVGLNLPFPINGIMGSLVKQLDVKVCSAMIISINSQMVAVCSGNYQWSCCS